MNLVEYKAWQPKLNPEWVKEGPYEMKLLWAILEMVGEAGEVLELPQKSVRKCKPIDHDKLLDELSDVLWGFTAICNIAGFTYEEVAGYNHDKLEARHKESK